MSLHHGRGIVQDQGSEKSMSDGASEQRHDDDVLPLAADSTDCGTRQSESARGSHTNSHRGKQHTRRDLTEPIEHALTEIGENSANGANRRRRGATRRPLGILGVAAMRSPGRSPTPLESGDLETRHTIMRRSAARSPSSRETTASPPPGVEQFSANWRRVGKSEHRHRIANGRTRAWAAIVAANTEEVHTAFRTRSRSIGALKSG